ncbi:hypothetical protein BDR26DRAFT_866238 [Obelidium mucronatum]|nr:hypothetical protein BDR26DRAFT_866238 [Obelidium mucronatum]
MLFLLLVTGSHVDSLPASPTQATPLTLGISATLAPGQTTYFDLCTTCIITDEIGTLILTEACAPLGDSGLYDFEAECGPNGQRSIYVLPGSSINTKILYNPRVANMTQFALRYHFPDYINSTDQPWTDTVLDNAPFYPADLGHAPVYHTLTIPKNILNRTWAYDYGYFQLGYFTFGKTQQPSDFILRVVRNVSIDTTNEYWIAPPPAIPDPTDSATDSDIPNNNAPTTITNQYVYVTIISVLIGIAILFTIIGYIVIQRKRKTKNRIGDSPSSEELTDLPPKTSMQMIPDLDDFDDDDDAGVIVYVKQRGGAYTPSMNSRGGAGGTSGGGSIGSYPRSILKSSKQVQEETIAAQMYNPDPMVAMQQQQQQHEHVESGNSRKSDGNEDGGKLVSAKKVFFKETVELAVVDMSMPPAIGAIPNGLFDDSDSEYDDEVDEDGEDFVHFNDGGVEKGIREILGKAVQVDEDEEEDGEDNSSDVGDDWRKE